MSDLRRGFKAWCERLAATYRQELGLSPIAPLSPWDLANYLEVIVWTPDQIPDFDAKLCEQLTGADSSAWSAVTLCSTTCDLIVINSAHSRGRQSNDLMHEIAHLLLGHNPSRIDVTEDLLLVLNTYDRGQEEEADWLAAAMLLPRIALIEILARRCNLDVAAREYGVSQSLLEMRMNRTGARIQDRRRGFVRPIS